MPHIHTAPGQYDITAAGYIVRLDGDEPRIMLHMHVKLGRWMQYGGHVELDESPWRAALREVMEEAGYDDDQLQVAQPPFPVPYVMNVGDGIVHPVPAHLATYPYGGSTEHFHTDVAYVFVANQAPRNPVATDEANEHRLFTRRELEQLGDEQILASVRNVSLLAFELATAWPLADTAAYVRQ